jgi:plasmid stabilization system protein ParE
VRLSFDHEAELELELAVDWYAEISTEVAVRFVDAVDEALRGIQEAPNASPTWGKNRSVRKRRVRAFPYALIYRVLPDEVKVVAVPHLRRGPGWLSARFRR